MVSKSQKRNLITFYLREEFKPDFERFLKLIEKDPRLIELRNKPKDGLLSIAMSQFILRYLDEQDSDSEPIKEEKQEVENETDKSMDKETTGN